MSNEEKELFTSMIAETKREMAEMKAMLAKLVKQKSEPETKHQYLTIKEAAKQLSVGYMTMYRMVHSGEIKSIKKGHSNNALIRILPEALEQFKQQNKTIN